jgi:hypothetical protein
MKAKLAAAAVMLSLLVTAVPALLAHHAFSAEYDNQKPITLKGKFVQMDWVNPHSWVHMEVTYPDGKVVKWAGETPPPNVLYRSGWRKDYLKVGDEIQITGFAAKDGTPHMWASSVILLSTGQRIFQMNAPVVPRTDGK